MKSNEPATCEPHKKAGTNGMKYGNTESLLLRGIPASPGIAIGRVRLLDRERIPVKEIGIEETQAEEEVARFEAAVAKTKRDFANIQKMSGVP